MEYIYFSNLILCFVVLPSSISTLYISFLSVCQLSE